MAVSVDMYEDSLAWNQKQLKIYCTNVKAFFVDASQVAINIIFTESRIIWRISIRITCSYVTEAGSKID